MNKEGTKIKLRFLYICPNKKCGNVIFKAEKFLGEEIIVKIKCQKCGRIWEFDELLVKRI